MKKFIVAVLAAAVATLSFIPDAEARGGGHRWQHHGGGHHYGGRHHGYRHHGYRHGGYRGHGHYHGHGRYNHGGYYGGYYGGGYYGGGWGWGFGFPGIVIAPGYYDGYAADCYVKKVRRYDSHGNRYTRRVRVCN